MIGAVILVLRETLEATFLLSILFVMSRYLGQKNKVLTVAIIIGFMSSILVATAMPLISNLFDGVGQELLFFMVLISLAMCIQVTIYSSFEQILFHKVNKLLAKTIGSIIILAISLEGAEIFLYVKSTFYSKIMGSIIGLGIGLSLGIISFYLFLFLGRLGRWLSLLLLTLISAGMASQALSYLMQANYLRAGYPLWNSNDLIAETSLVGQLLYALLGYEASPTAQQVLVYISFLLAPIIYHHRLKKRARKD